MSAQFPGMRYNHETRARKIVNSEAESVAAAKDGFINEPLKPIVVAEPEQRENLGFCEDAMKLEGRVEKLERDLEDVRSLLGQLRPLLG